MRRSSPTHIGTVSVDRWALPLIVKKLGMTPSIGVARERVALAFVRFLELDDRLVIGIDCLPEFLELPPESRSSG